MFKFIYFLAFLNFFIAFCLLALDLRGFTPFKVDSNFFSVTGKSSSVNFSTGLAFTTLVR